MVCTATAGMAGVVIARSFGASAKGEYAAIMVWFGLLVVVGGLGQQAATTYFVARDPGRARDYVSVSRNLMLASGAAILVAGLVAVPLSGAESGAVAWGYRLMLASCLIATVSISYTCALQGLSIARWNLARLTDSTSFLVVVAALYATGRLTLVSVLVAFLATRVVQTALAYGICVRSGLTGGRPSFALARPLAHYGAGQLAATIPTVVVARLDQLALSVTANPAVLGNYAVAASLATVALPVAVGVGNVAFPRIAAQRGSGSAAAPPWRSVVASGGIALALTIPPAALAPWLVPALFGADFHDAVLLTALLAPRGVFLACQQVCADILRGYGRPFVVARAQWTSAALMAGLLCVLLPAAGGAGAAIAATASAAVSLLLLVRALKRPQPYDERKE
jgi:O-antigen/teichoic acid export membrane protein